MDYYAILTKNFEKLNVFRKNESYNGVTYEFGIVDSRGQWAMEMTDDVAMFDRNGILAYSVDENPVFDGMRFYDLFA